MFDVKIDQNELSVDGMGGFSIRLDSRPYYETNRYFHGTVIDARLIMTLLRLYLDRYDDPRSL